MELQAPVAIAGLGLLHQIDKTREVNSKLQQHSQYHVGVEDGGKRSLLGEPREGLQGRGGIITRTVARAPSYVPLILICKGSSRPIADLVE